eukprot:scaffold7767_cov135-Isochrysis_galbana.AAC.2
MSDPGARHPRCSRVVLWSRPMPRGVPPTGCSTARAMASVASGRTGAAARPVAGCSDAAGHNDAVEHTDRATSAENSSRARRAMLAGCTAAGAERRNGPQMALSPIHRRLMEAQVSARGHGAVARGGMIVV